MRLIGCTIVVLIFALAIATIVWLVRFLIRLRRQRTAGGPIMIWLKRQPRSFEPRELAQLIRHATGQSLTLSDNPQIQGALIKMPAETGDSGHELYLLTLTPWPLCIAVSKNVYFTEEAQQELARSYPELRIVNALKEHQAWVSVSAFSEPPAESREACFRNIARIARALAGGEDEALLLIRLPEGHHHFPTPELMAALEAPDPLQAIAGIEPIAPMIGAEGDDAELEAAKQEAQTRFGEFRDAFNSRQRTQQFAVKAPLPTRSGSFEHIWIQVESIGETEIQGLLGNEPMDIPDKKIGDRVKVKVTDVEDWTITDENSDELRGGFSVKVLMARYQRQSK